MIKTKHYLKRMAERGFNDDVVKCIFNYGEWNLRGDRLVITKESRKNILLDIEIIQDKIHEICNNKELKSVLKFLRKYLRSLLKVISRKSPVLVIKECHLITIY